MTTATWPVILVQLGLAALIVAVSLRGLRALWREYGSRNWPRVQATVLESRVVEAPFGMRRGLVGSHLWAVRYRYRVNGRVYESEPQLPFGATIERSARMMAERFPPGSTFPVRHDPADPTHAMLAKDTRFVLVQLLTRAALLVLLLAALAWVLWVGLGQA